MESGTKRQKIVQRKKKLEEMEKGKANNVLLHILLTAYRVSTKELRKEKKRNEKEKQIGDEK